MNGFWIGWEGGLYFVNRVPRVRRFLLRRNDRLVLCEAIRRFSYAELTFLFCGMKASLREVLTYIVEDFDRLSVTE